MKRFPCSCTALEPIQRRRNELHGPSRSQGVTTGNLHRRLKILHTQNQPWKASLKHGPSHLELALAAESRNRKRTLSRLGQHWGAQTMSQECRANQHRLPTHDPAPPKSPAKQFCAASEASAQHQVRPAPFLPKSGELPAMTMTTFIHFIMSLLAVPVLVAIFSIGGDLISVDSASTARLCTQVTA